MIKMTIPKFITEEVIFEVEIAIFLQYILRETFSFYVTSQQFTKTLHTPKQPLLSSLVFFHEPLISTTLRITIHRSCSNPRLSYC